MKQPNDIFLELLRYPNSPKIYRDIQKYYQGKGMLHEAEAFNNMLRTRFKTINDTTDDSDSDKKQQEDSRADTGIFEGT